MKIKPHIAVVGAGAFGGWTALHLAERGARVTLLDAWGPGNSRASSGGETRVMRGTYGPDQPYTEMAAEALRLWAKYQRKWKRQLLHTTGVLWMAAARNDTFERGSIEMLRAARIPYQELSAREMKKRWPQINFADIEWGIFEPACGYLQARESCAAVLSALIRAGGSFQQSAVSGPVTENSPIRSLELSSGARLQADGYVFACGPWLPRLFPEAIGNRIQVTKQDVFFFGTPRGDSRFSDAAMPVWADHGESFRYGIPGSDRRGFKIADDTRGPEFDPTGGERLVDPEGLRQVREYVAFRFPGLKHAPLLETRVCQYEQTSDGHFIMDRHPACENVWLLGGGSGHGFKHGPAIGNRMAEWVLNDREPDRIWKLERSPKALLF